MNRRLNRCVPILALAPLALGAALGIVSALAFGTSPAFADDSIGTPTDSQLLKQCMERQRTATVTVSDAQAKRFCKDQLKRQKETGASPEPAPVDAPRGPDDPPPPEPPPG